MEISTKEQAVNAVTWIKALDTTTEKQGKQQLGDKLIGFCCLGLGCSVLGINYDPEKGASKQFKVKVGLRTSTGSNVKRDNSLVQLNDTLNFTFKEISKVMRLEPEQYFKIEVAKEIKQLL